MTKKIVVLIPCLNEEKTVGKVINEFKKIVPSAEIHIFDNNSHDKTKLIAKKLGVIVHNVREKGKGNVMVQRGNEGCEFRSPSLALISPTPIPSVSSSSFPSLT